MNPDISVIIPVFNEAAGIKDLVHSLSAYFLKHSFRAEVIFVDDGSVDGSAELLKKENHDLYEARLVRFKKNCGSHAAIRAGILSARGERMICLPADLQDPLELIGALNEKSLQGYPVVFAARRVPQGGFGNRTASWLYAWFVRRTLFRDFPENGFDVVMFNRSVQEELNRNIKKNASLFLQILSLKKNSSYLWYEKRGRKSGESKWTFSKKIKLFLDSFFPSRENIPADQLFSIAEICSLPGVLKPAASHVA